MKLTDIIALATKGYKPSDIRELIELAKESEAVPEVSETEEAAAEEPEEKAPEIDYAAEIEKLRKENEKIRADLQKAQQANIRSAVPESKKESDEDIIKDICLTFMR